MKLTELVKELARFEDRVPRDLLEELVPQVAISTEELGRIAQFSPDNYMRIRINKTSAYELLLMTWQPGQRSPIHNHRGSVCAMKIMQGTATEIVFETSPIGLIYPVKSNTLKENQCTVAEDADIHQVANLGAINLITTHLYSPPLTNMERFTLKDSTFAGAEALAIGSTTSATVDAHLF